MKTAQCQGVSRLSNSNDNTPWEDAVILAFRDMQWMRRQRANYGAFVTAHKKQQSEQQPSVEVEERLRDFLTQTCTPPPLLAKLDGHAETASGDTLTSINKRFFLLEFKASKGKLKTEKIKFMHELMTNVDPDKDVIFVTLSRRGHFVVYPEFSKGQPRAQQGLLPVHEASLETQPYLDALRGNQWLSAKTTPRHIAPAPAETVLWDVAQGLSLEEMAAYLEALCEAHSDEGSSHPMKAIIATPDGLIWPIADLSQLTQLAPFFHARPNSNMSTQLQRKEMHETATRFKTRTVGPVSNAHVQPSEEDQATRPERGSSPAP